MVSGHAFLNALGGWVQLELDPDTTRSGLYVYSSQMGAWYRVSLPESAKGDLYVYSNKVGNWVNTTKAATPVPVEPWAGMTMFPVSEAEKPTITIGHITANPGDYVEIPVYLSNNVHGISNYWLKFGYNPSLFDFESILFAGSNFGHSGPPSGQPDKLLLDLSQESNGVILLKDAMDQWSTANQMNDGILMFIRGYVSSAIPVSVTQIDLNILGQIGTGTGTEVFLNQIVNGSVVNEYYKPVGLVNGYISVTGNTYQSPPMFLYLPGSGNVLLIKNSEGSTTVNFTLNNLTLNVPVGYTGTGADGVLLVYHNNVQVGISRTFRVQSGVNNLTDEFLLTIPVTEYGDLTYQFKVTPDVGDANSYWLSETGNIFTATVDSQFFSATSDTDNLGGFMSSVSDGYEADIWSTLPDLDIGDDMGEVTDAVDEDTWKTLDDLDVGDNTGSIDDGEDID